jgi:malonyl CoA-acyl carrier protein transacylase
VATPQQPTHDDAEVLLFPGQGSQHDAMRAGVAAHAPDLLERACELLGSDPFERLADGTEFVQPAVFCASVAGCRAIEGSVRPAAFAGHSLGEYAALVAAGAVDAHDALGLVVTRGRISQRVAARVGGGMLALLGVDRETADGIAERCGAAVANDNCRGQLVLSGPVESLWAAEAEALGMKKHVRMLAIDGAFHSPLMAEAVPPFADALAQVEFRRPRAPVYSSVSARPFDDPRRQLAESLVSPVRWREVLEDLGGRGVRRFVEVAPGHVLADMIRRTIRGATAIAAERDGLPEATPQGRT